MASTPTLRNRLNKQGTGDNVASWGNVLNTQAVDLVDEALDGLTNVGIAGNVTLTSTNYTSDQSRKRILKLTGSPGASFIVTVPSVEKWYLVHNQTNAAQTLKAGGVGASVPASSLVSIYCDGVDCFAPPSPVTAPIGVTVDFAGTTAPAGWLLCNGQAVSRTTYAALFAIIGGGYGVGDGSTTFNVPDLRGRVTAGRDSMGATAANRLTASYFASPDGFGATGGAQSVTLDLTQIPSHPHGVTDPGHIHPITDPGHTHGHGVELFQLTPGGAGNAGALGTTDPSFTGITINGAVTGISIQAAGGGLGHSNIQPTALMNKIIYAGV